LIKEKVQVVIGDLNMPSLGLSDADRAAIIKNVNVVIHCAANLDGKERLDTATMVSWDRWINNVEVNDTNGTFENADKHHRYNAVDGFG
jgi:hypothetical protein